MNTILKTCLITFLSLASISCSTYSDRQNVGMVAGGVLGGVAGSAITGGSPAGAIVGAVGGGFVGRSVAN